MVSIPIENIKIVQWNVKYGGGSFRVSVKVSYFIIVCIEYNNVQFWMTPSLHRRASQFCAGEKKVL